MFKIYISLIGLLLSYNMWGMNDLCQRLQGKSKAQLDILLQGNINIYDDNHKSLLFYAVVRGEEDLVKYLLDFSYIDIDSIDNESGLSALHMAVLQNKPHIVALLLTHSQCSVDIASVNGITPLTHAYHQGYDEIIKMLLDHGADATLAHELISKML